MKRILLVADACIDVYHMGHSSRLSPEAPVPVFVEEYWENRNGMGLNVKDNLEKLELEVVSYTSPPSYKHRYVDIKSKYQMFRNDIPSHSSDSETWGLGDLYHGLNSFDAVVVSDYDKGYIPLSSIKYLINKCFNNGIPCFIDTKKKEALSLKYCILKINEQEYNESRKHVGELESLRSSWEGYIIKTLGENGVEFHHNIYPVKKSIVHDVTGAGDTFLASLVFQYLHTKSFKESIEFANKAASITVQKFGTYAPSIQEINAID